MSGIDRRGFVKAAGIALVGLPMAASAASGRMFGADVDASLFETINRVVDPEKMTGTELHHVPVISVPEKVAKGEPFMAEVSVGRELHVTTASHRITEVTLLAGNEPVGTVTLASLYSRPRVAFLVSVDKPVTLVAQARCNLHGVWEGSLDINPG